MVISSRTPEGDPNRCPICGCDVRLEPSWPRRDAPCPKCGHLLWFSRPSNTAGEEARSAGLEAALLKAVEARFGKAPPETRVAIMALTEQADLERAMNRVLSARTLAEVLAQV